MRRRLPGRLHRRRDRASTASSTSTPTAASSAARARPPAPTARSAGGPAAGRVGRPSRRIDATWFADPWTARAAVDAAAAASRPDRTWIATPRTPPWSERADLTDDIARFRVGPDDGVPSFEPGQYLALGLRVDDRLVQRPYSTASRPASGDDARVPDPTRARRDADPAAVGGAAGRAAPARSPEGPVHAPGRTTPGRTSSSRPGPGLAPFVSMLDACSRARSRRRSVVVHGVARASELGVPRTPRAAAGRGAPVVYAPTVSRVRRPGERGLAGPDRARRGDPRRPRSTSLHLAAGSTVAYLCGNPGMIAAADTVLRRRGLPAEAIRSEHYWPLEDGTPAVTAGRAA